MIARFFISLITLVGLMTSCGVAEAQNTRDQRVRLTGQVTDNDGLPIPGAHVFVEGASIGTTTNIDGRYRLSLAPATYVLVFSAIGYERVVVTVIVSPPSIAVDQTLPALVIEVGEVVVSAARRPQLAREVPASLEVLPAEQLETRNVVSLDDALQNVSGLQVQGNQINIRGTSGFAYNTGSRVLLLIDGFPLLSPDSDGLPLDALPPTRIRQIEVLKGPGSALYGSGAVGGVVNIVTAGIPDKREIAFRTFAGAYEPTRHSAWSRRWRDAANWRPFGGVAISVADRLGPRSGGWFSLDFRDDSGFRNLSTTRQLQSFAKLESRLTSDLEFNVLAGVIARRRDSYLFWNGLADALNPGTIQLSETSSPSGTNDTATRQFMLQPEVRLRRDRSLLIGRLRGFATLIRPIRDDGSLKPLSEGTAGARFGGEFQWQRFLGQQSQLIAGAAIDANATRSSFYQTDDGGSAGQQPEVGLYAQFESRPIEAVSAVAGLRFDLFRVSSRLTTKRLSPKLSVGYHLSDAVTIRASSGLGFRVPSLAERYTEDQSFFPIFRNPTLRPEKSASAEAGIRAWQQIGRSWSIEWDASAFHYWLTDLIEPRFVRTEPTSGGGGQLGFQFVNLPSGRVAGLEARIEADGPEWGARVGYTFLHTRDDETDAPLPFRPRHLVVSGLDGKVGRLTVGLDIRFASQPETLDSDFARFVPDADVLIDSRVVDVHAGWRIGPLVARLIVRNATNYYYLERPALLAAPRSVTLQITGAL